MTSPVPGPARSGEALPPKTLDIQAVVKHSFLVLVRNPGKVALVALLFGAPALAIEVAGWGEPNPAPTTILGTCWALAVLFPKSIPGHLVAAPLVYVAVRSAAGRTWTLRRAMFEGLLNMPWVLVTATLALLAIGAGTFFCVLPGLFVGTLLWVALPAAVVERSGAVHALRRSVQLTKKSRWQVFLLVLALAFLVKGSNLALEVIFRPAKSLLGEAGVVALAYVPTVCLGALLHLGAAFTYLQLRGIAEPNWQPGLEDDHDAGETSLVENRQVGPLPESDTNQAG
jgi:hypothetical protein